MLNPAQLSLGGECHTLVRTQDQPEVVEYQKEICQTVNGERLDPNLIGRVVADAAKDDRHVSQAHAARYWRQLASTGLLAVANCWHTHWAALLATSHHSQLRGPQHSYEKMSSPHHTTGIMGPVNRLPCELLDMVVNHMDKRDLVACTLISRSWRLSAHPLLFQTLAIYDDSDPHADSQSSPRADSGCCDTAHNIKAFLTLLTTESASTIIPFVKRLSLQGCYGYELCTTDIDRMVARLPALESLSFCEMMLCPSIGPLDLSCRSKPLPLKRLGLYNVSIQRPSSMEDFDQPAQPPVNYRCAFMELLGLFGCISTLHLDEVEVVSHRWPSWTRYDYWRTPRLAIEATSSYPNTLRIPKLVTSAGDVLSHLDVLALLKYSHALDDLHELEIQDSETSYNLLFPVIGSTLRNLNLALDRFPEQLEDDVRSLPHFVLSNLTSLHITVPVFKYSSDEDDSEEIRARGAFASSHVLSILSMVHTAIERFQITFEFAAGQNQFLSSYIQPFNWTVIDQTLSTKFKKLRSLDIIFADSGESMNSEPEIGAAPNTKLDLKILVRIRSKLKALNEKRLVMFYSSARWED
ncbi:hypothetical protein EIP91_002001 [Steccherinum ochraceum]|uniref:F-box domain-containing protein n=1 Tax=Steccherinum ochraceum TaxID=92696 RepID=A0A4R0RGP0_9APHY|nr:hypothetical protein EIP91_002001 [Steccherinum ochraceum]